MSRPAPTLPWSVDDFLGWEREQEGRYEWDGSTVVAMTGATLGHNTVAGNIYAALRARRPTGCRVFTEGVKLRAGDSVRSPDVVIACSATFDLGADVLEDATFVVEVLSPSTARTDRVAKVAGYARIPSLEGYLIVDPERRHIELYRRENTELIPTPADELADDSVVLFRSVTISIADVYEGVL